MLFIDNMN